MSINERDAFESERAITTEVKETFGSDLFFPNINQKHSNDTPQGKEADNKLLERLGMPSASDLLGPVLSSVGKEIQKSVENALGRRQCEPEAATAAFSSAITNLSAVQLD